MSQRAPGSVLLYPYWWRSDARRGVENPKDRTTTLVISQKAATRDGATLVHLFLLGITDSPRASQSAIEIPPIEKRRAGLDPARAAFVVVSEYNYDVLPLSHDYDPNSKTFGTFSPAFTELVRMRFLRSVKDGIADRLERIAPGTM